MRPSPSLSLLAVALIATSGCHAHESYRVARGDWERLAALPPGAREKAAVPALRLVDGQRVYVRGDLIADAEPLGGDGGATHDVAIKALQPRATAGVVLAITGAAMLLLAGGLIGGGYMRHRVTGEDVGTQVGVGFGLLAPAGIGLASGIGLSVSGWSEAPQEVPLGRADVRYLDVGATRARGLELRLRF